MIPTITIKDAARLVGLRTDKPGRNPKQLAQAIKYSLEATVQRGVKDPYTETIASVMGWPTPEEVRASMNYAKADAAASDAMATLTEAAKDFGGAAKKVAGTFPKHTHDQGEETIYIPSHPAIIHPAVDPDPKFKAKKTKAKKEQTRLATHAEPKKVKPLADIVAGRTVIMVGLSVVLLADFVACCLNWWTHFGRQTRSHSDGFGHRVRRCWHHCRTIRVRELHPKQGRRRGQLIRLRLRCLPVNDPRRSTFPGLVLHRLRR